MSETIPEELQKIAGAVVADIINDTRLLTMGEVQAMSEPIAAALLAERLAERERAAKIAEGAADAADVSAVNSYWEKVHTLSFLHLFAKGTANRIATAIRSQP